MNSKTNLILTSDNFFDIIEFQKKNRNRTSRVYIILCNRSCSSKKRYDFGYNC